MNSPTDRTSTARGISTATGTSAPGAGQGVRSRHLQREDWRIEAWFGLAIFCMLMVMAFSYDICTIIIQSTS